MRRPAKVVIGVILAAAIFFAGYLAKGPSAPATSPSSTRQATSYTCRMHPQYTSVRPGDCPICGMRLEPATAEGGSSKSALGTADTAGMVVVGGASQQLIGVRTDEVRCESSSHVLRVPGRIAVDDQRLYRIIAAVDGWIVDLQQNSVGRSVKKDQLLASYYTKDLLYTERLFLLSIPATDQLPSATDFTQASIRTAGSANPMFPIDSLRGLGMSDLQIEEIHKTRTAAPHVDIYSPVSGFVLTRNVSPGQRFDKGTELYRIADISRVWVMTDIFEKDRAFLKPGAEAALVYQGRRLKARMSDVLPQFDTQSRTLKTRFELDNPGNVLQPDMFVDVEVDVEMPPAMTVPADAVFDSGLRKTVFVDHGNGKFEARRVEAGWRLGDRVEITRGLMEGERVAAAANFLLDSESRMRAVAAGIFNPESDPVCGMEVDGRKAAAASRTAAHEGHTYYFCSDQCKKSFQANPGHYLEHSHPNAGSAVAANAPGAIPPMKLSTMKTSAPAPAKGGMAMDGAAAHTGQAIVKDLVCGMDVDPKDPEVAARKVEYRGRAYYFCSDDCRTKFQANPAAYVKQ